MRKFVVSGLLGLALYCNAQTPQRINSGEVIASAVKLHDAGKYKEAIALYRTVPRNDTNYVLSLYEQTLSYRADSNFTEALHASEAALAIPNNDYEVQLLASYGSTLDDLGQPDRAVRVYDSALLKYPRSAPLRLNKGITLLRAKKLTDAATIFKTLLLENPYYASAHYRLAQCALQQGELVPAMFSLFTYLVISPDGPFYSNCITQLNNIARGSDDMLQYVDARTGGDDLFSGAEQILLSKIALDKAYKVKTNLDDPIIRQLQVVSEKVTYDAASSNFWMQYYVPFFQAVYKEDYFEPLVYHAFSNINLEPIQRYVKKNDKEIKKAIEATVAYFNPIRSTRELQVAQRQAAPVRYHFEEGDFAGIGTRDSKGTLTGKWEFYHTNGNLKSTGLFNAKGEKEGEWKYYSKNGMPTGSDNWNAGKQTGEDITYNSQGLVSTKAHFQNGELQGNKEQYYGIGHLYSKGTYRAGKQDGPYVEYYSNGRKKVEAIFKNDELDGAYRSYYKNGQLETEVTYSRGKLEGLYKLYHDNGQLSKTGTYKGGKLQGEAKEYHPNGKLKKLHTFVDDAVEGDELEYNTDGVLIAKTPYKGGKAQGTAEYYDSDGKLFSTFQFDKNLLRVAKYVDKSGKEIAHSERQGKTIDLTVYSPDGFKVSTATYNEKDEKEGTNTYFYKSGKVREIDQYKSGKLNGMSTGYYADGTKQYEVHYTDDERDGLSTYYYPSGALQSQGWYDKGVLNDTWTAYNEKGAVTLRTTYNSDDITGYRPSYHANGKLDDEELYRNGWLVAIYQYDTLGNRIHTAEFKNGNGAYKGIHFNGNTSYEGQYVQGEFHGTFKGYFFDGSPSFVKTFDRGLLEGAYTDYYYGGKTASTGQYKGDKRTGTWTFYSYDGTLSRQETYVDGELNGKRIYYYSNGKPEREYEYKNDMRNGTLKRFAPDGQLNSVFYFEDDEVTGYSYPDKSGQLVPMKPLPGGNGKVETFYSNGAKSTEMEYKAGLLVGPNRLYFPNGKLYYESFEVYNNTDGRLKEYYENGNLKREYQYVLDKEEGPYKEYYENGKVREEGMYYNGVPNGVVKFYDATGKLVQTRTYYFGTLLNASK